MFDFDATDYEIQRLQEKIYSESGVTQEEFDLGDYVGLTYGELLSIAQSVIRKANERKGV